MSPSGVKIRLSVTFSSFGVCFRSARLPPRSPDTRAMPWNQELGITHATVAPPATTMKIFQVLEFNQFNTGSVHQMFQAATGLRERGHDVTVVSKPDPMLEAKRGRARRRASTASPSAISSTSTPSAACAG